MTKVSVVADAETLAHTVADQLSGVLGTIQASGRVPSVVLTGGTIAAEIYKALAQLDPEAVDWTRVDFWWGDERYVPADSSDRNDHEARRNLLDVVGADPARVHSIPAADEVDLDLAAAAAAYGEQVRTHGGDRFDLVLLGLGPDGHVASLFPGFPQLEAHEDAVAVTGSPKPPPDRITLTFDSLNRTREVWFVVAGGEKADAVARALADEGSVQETPARGITCEQRTWWLDEAAAASL